MALPAAIIAAAIVLIARSRLRPTRRRPVRPAVLTAEHPKHRAAEPSAPDRPPVTTNVQRGGPWESLDAAARRRLARWGAAGLALLLLAAGAQALDSAVFSKDAAVEALAEDPYESQDETCDGKPEASQADCLFVLIRQKQGDQVSSPADGGETQEPVPASESAYESSPDADCRPRNAEPRVRKLDTKVTRAVNRQWRRIEAWLKANAPRSHRTLGKPGKAEAIAAAEARMGLLFPDDLRASLLRHDGTVFVKDTWGFGFLGNSNLTVREIRDAWQGLCEIDGEDEGDPRTEWWDGRMLPFGADGMGDHLVIDSVWRDVGDTDHEGSMSFRPGGVRIHSYYALLKATADALENGGSIGFWKPEVVAGELDWEVV
jgi:hypothetical protein